jgi:outer membrane protein
VNVLDVALTAAAWLLAAQPPASPLLVRGTSVQAMIAARDYEDAEVILRQRIRDNPRDAGAHFLLGMIAVRRGSLTAAAAEFRAALAINPGLVRVRLELARVLFRQGNYRSALRHFQLAEASNLPPAVRVNVDRFLGAIRNAKAWSYNVDFAVAPDSNINAATSAREAIIFGLPFTLDDQARRHSGIGLSVSGNVEFAPRVSSLLRFRMGALASRRDYRANSFDDDYYGVYAGPRLQLGAFDISLLGTAGRRFYGRRLNQRSAGGRLEASYYASPTTAAVLTVLSEHLQFPALPLEDGWLTAVDAGVVKAVTPVSSISGDLGVIRQTARAPTLSSRGLFAALGYRRELRDGFGLDVQPTISYSVYGAVDPFFGKRRRDATEQVAVSVTNQKFAIWQFTPRLTYRFTKRASSISLYSFTQSRIEIGLTTDF